MDKSEKLYKNHTHYHEAPADQRSGIERAYLAACVENLPYLRNRANAVGHPHAVNSRRARLRAYLRKGNYLADFDAYFKVGLALRLGGGSGPDGKAFLANPVTSQSADDYIRDLTRLCWECAEYADKQIKQDLQEQSEAARDKRMAAILNESDSPWGNIPDRECADTLTREDVMEILQYLQPGKRRKSCKDNLSSWIREAGKAWIAAKLNGRNAQNEQTYRNTFNAWARCRCDKRKITPQSLRETMKPLCGNLGHHFTDIDKRVAQHVKDRLNEIIRDRMSDGPDSGLRELDENFELPSEITLKAINSDDIQV